MTPVLILANQGMPSTFTSVAILYFFSRLLVSACFGDSGPESQAATQNNINDMNKIRFNVLETMPMFVFLDFEVGIDTLDLALLNFSIQMSQRRR
jgi:hypothetical protein